MITNDELKRITIRTLEKKALFEPNDPKTWNAVRTAIREELEPLLDGEDLHVKVYADSSQKEHGVCVCEVVVGCNEWVFRIGPGPAVAELATA